MFVFQSTGNGLQTHHTIHITVVQAAADKMATIISRRHTNSSALAAVIEVKVETTIINNHIDRSKWRTGKVIHIVLQALGL